MTAEALAARVARMAATQATAAERNRARAPEFAAFVDRVRELFGEGAKVRKFQITDEKAE